MKRFSIALAILALMLAGSLWAGREVAQVTQRCSQQLEQAQQLANQGQWEQARELTSQSYRYWLHCAPALHALLRHTDTDQVLLSYRSVEQYLLLEEMDQYAAANVTLMTQLELLAEMEQPTLENVL